MQPQAQAANEFVNKNSELLRECETLREANSKVLTVNVPCVLVCTMFHFMYLCIGECTNSKA